MSAERRHGAPMRCPKPVLARILVMHHDGTNCAAIARVFNIEGIPTPAGGDGRWERFNVNRLLGTITAREMRAELFEKSRSTAV